MEFIYNSMFHLDTVMPDSVGLYVPGGYYRQPLANNSYVPLHRNYYGNRSRTQGSGQVRRALRGNYTDRPDGQKNQCDEYPFSASYENANYYDPGTAATWAVKPVLALHNSNSGNALSIFYLYDHILDSDQYYVKIDNPSGITRQGRRPACRPDCGRPASRGRVSMTITATLPASTNGLKRTRA